MDRQQLIAQPSRVHQIKKSSEFLEHQQRAAPVVNQDILLHSAVLEQNEKVVKFLLKHGADANVRIRFGKEPMQNLSAEPNPEMREVFYRYRSTSINSTDCCWLNLSLGTRYTLSPYTGRMNKSASNLSRKYRSFHRDSKNRNPTPMHVAAANGNRGILELLLNHGGDVNLELEGDYTALSIAILRRHFDIAEMLIKQGADVNYRGRSGKSPLQFAVKSKQIEMVQLLLRNGADVKSRTEHGVTALHIAVERKLEDVVELLLKNGSDVNAKTRTGVTPLHCAAVKGQTEITEMILRYGGDPSVIMKKGEIDVTPLLWVTESEKRRITEIINRYVAVAKSNKGGYCSRMIKKVWKNIAGKKCIFS
ncbi:hypothetical protein TSAR_006805 [Trichomalopsis sarcophagae]|uniref:Uncharacterized protein n=1 Tax=Trichomalopsis sarcophagae TaxID=543379 RepID=A0A232FDQ2_9HYME|nr:hypothetical protein TSAR_006805 [Trichomalopsis sarcophagae]